MQSVASISATTSTRVDALLRVRDLAVSFPDRERAHASRSRAVNGVSFTIHPRQTLAMLGESGCGKSITALSIMRLVQPPGVIERGEILFNQSDLLTLSPSRMLKVRGGKIAMIFQEPMTSLNPVFSVGEQLCEAVQLHQRVGRKAAHEIAARALEEVGIKDVARRLHDYPHQFSGGMRQRVMIAMALACQPQLLIADEPTTALDVTVQAQILGLLKRLQHERGMSVLFITHDLGVAAQIADVVCVMYAGRVVEYARGAELFENPLHPYTRALLRCRPSLTDRTARLINVRDIAGDPSEFLLRSMHGQVITPWWPIHGSANHAIAPALIEAQPQHWISCVPSEGLVENEVVPDIASARLS